METLITKFTKFNHILDLDKSAERDFSNAVHSSLFKLELVAESLENKLDIMLSSKVEEMCSIEEWEKLLEDMDNLSRDKKSVEIQHDKLWKKRQDLIDKQNQFMERQEFIYDEMMRIFNEAQKMGKIFVSNFFFHNNPNLSYFLEIIHDLQQSLEQLDGIRSKSRFFLFAF